MATYTNQSQSASSWSNGTQSSTSFTNQALDNGFYFLLQEDGSYLLLETGSKILLEQTPVDAGWSNQSES